MSFGRRNKYFECSLDLLYNETVYMYTLYFTKQFLRSLTIYGSRRLTK